MEKKRNKLLANCTSVAKFGNSYISWKHLVVLVKMNSPCDIISNYRASTTMKLDTLAGTDFHKK